MKTPGIVAVLAATLFISSMSALARDHHDGHRHEHKYGHHRGHVETVYAEVIAVEPVYEVTYINTPRRECEERRTVYDDRHHAGTGMLIGGVIGGALGHTIARDGPNDAVVVAGTLLGAMVGHDLDHDGTRIRSETRAHCGTRYREHEERRIVGYRLTYRYCDRIYHTRTNLHPGTRIRVSIDVRG